MATTPVPGPGWNPAPVPAQKAGQILDPKWLNTLRNRVLATLTGLAVATGQDVSGDSSTDSTGTATLTLNLSETGVIAGTYGDSSHVGQFTVDAKGRITSAVDVAIVFPPMTEGPTSSRPTGVADGIWFLDISLTPARPILSYAASTTGWIDCAGADV